VSGDPLRAGYNFRSVFPHGMNGRLAAADQAAERGLDPWPGHTASWLAAAGLLAYTGGTDRALAMLDEAPARPVALPPPLLQQMRACWTALQSGTPDHLLPAGR
jgi:hypothetical protein